MADTTGIDRRTLMAAAAATTLVPGAAVAADDEAYWRAIAAQYDVTRDVIQLENGNWGMMARPVLAAYERALERVNRDTSYYTRRTFDADYARVRAQVAALLGVKPTEIALTRNATEALKTLILGYNALRPGDAVLYADLDYDSMQSCMESLAARRGVTVELIALPEPATWQGLIDAYAKAFDANPKIRLVLLTHLSHRTGLVLPVAEIVALARSRGIDAIVDAAHSFGQIDMNFGQQNVDFAGFNLHKWWGAPLGVGVIYISEGALTRIDRDPGNDAEAADDTLARIHPGTADFAAQLTVPDAIAFQQAIGSARRAARLRLLRDRWAERLRGLDGLEVLTPPDARLHGGITSFRVRGRTSVEDNKLVAKALLDEFGIFTVHRVGVARGACVRVTPAVFTQPQQIDALAKALEILVPRMRRVN